MEPLLLGVDTYELLSGLDPEDYGVKERDDQANEKTSDDK